MKIVQKIQTLPEDPRSEEAYEPRRRPRKSLRPQDINRVLQH